MPSRSERQTSAISDNIKSTVNYETAMEISVSTSKLGEEISEKLAMVVHEAVLSKWANHINSTVNTLDLTLVGPVSVKIEAVEYEEDIAKIKFISYWNGNPIPAQIVTQDLAQLNLNRIAKTLGYPVHRITTYSSSESSLQKWWMIVLLAACGLVITIFGFFIIFIFINCDQSKSQLLHLNQRKVHNVYSSSAEPRRSNLMELSVQNGHEILKKISQLSSEMDQKCQNNKKTNDKKTVIGLKFHSPCKCFYADFETAEKKNKMKLDLPSKSTIIEKNELEGQHVTVDKWNVSDIQFDKNYVRREDRPKTAATKRKSSHVLDDIEIHGTGGFGHFNPYYAGDKAHDIMNRIIKEDEVDALGSANNHPKPSNCHVDHDIHMD